MKVVEIAKKNNIEIKKDFILINNENEFNLFKDFMQDLSITAISFNKQKEKKWMPCFSNLKDAQRFMLDEIIKIFGKLTKGLYEYVCESIDENEDNQSSISAKDFEGAGYYYYHNEIKHELVLSQKEIESADIFNFVFEDDGFEVQIALEII